MGRRRMLTTVAAARKKYLFLSPADDPDLIVEFRGSREHAVLPVAGLKDLSQEVKDELLERGFTLAIVDTKGAEIEESLPPGIFPQGVWETIEDALWRHGLPLTSLHARLDYATGMLDGIRTEDVLLDPAMEDSVYEEPVPRHTVRLCGQEIELPGWPSLPTDEAERETWERQCRLENVTAFLAMVRAALRVGYGPSIVRTQRGWRFIHWRDYSKMLNTRLWVRMHSPAAFIEAAWAFVWYARRRWLALQEREADLWVVNQRYSSTPAPACSLERKPVWLSEPHLAAIREVFRRLLKEYNLPLTVLRLREERKVISHLQRLQGRLAHLEALEEKGLQRLRALQEAGDLDEERAQAAVRFFDRLAEDKAKAQSELELVILHEAQEFYGKDFLGYDLLVVEHAPEELEELRAEVEVLA